MADVERVLRQQDGDGGWYTLTLGLDMRGQQEWLWWARVENHRTYRFPDPWPENPALAGKVFPAYYVLFAAPGRMPDINSKAGDPDFPPIPGPDPAIWPTETTTTGTTSSANGSIPFVDVRGPTMCSRQWGADVAPIDIRWDDENQVRLS